MQFYPVGFHFENGAFLTLSTLWQCCREVSEKYPDIVYEEVIIDNCCMMVMHLVLTSCKG